MLEKGIGNVKAYGVVTPEGFVVYKGAIISKTTAKNIGIGVMKLRNELIANGKVKDGVTKEDILFSSSSAAATFVLGYGVGGPQTWKAKDSRTLKEIEESNTNQQ